MKIRRVHHGMRTSCASIGEDASLSRTERNFCGLMQWVVFVARDLLHCSLQIIEGSLDAASCFRFCGVAMCRRGYPLKSYCTISPVNLRRLLCHISGEDADFFV